MRRDAPIQFRPGPLTSHLAARSGGTMTANEVARRDLDRYYAILGRELATVEFTDAEWMALRDALNGTLAEAWWSANELATEIEDALADGLGERWGLSATQGRALVERLRQLSPAQTFAVIDAVERWWARQG